MQEEPTKIWNRDFVYLLLIDLAVMLGNYMMRPIISTYAVELGASLAVAGIVAGLAFAVATLMRPVTGFLSDRLGKKTMFLILKNQNSLYYAKNYMYKILIKNAF